jgi:hypothetical protein
MEISLSVQISNWIVLTTHPHREDFAIENLVACTFQIAELRILANTDSVSLAQQAGE